MKFIRANVIQRLTAPSLAYLVLTLALLSAAGAQEGNLQTITIPEYSGAGSGCNADIFRFGLLMIISALWVALLCKGWRWVLRVDNGDWRVKNKRKRP